MEYRKYSEEEIESFRSDAGGFTKDAFGALGVNWPPTSGWRRRLLSGEDPNNQAEIAATFARLDDGWAVRVPCRSSKIIPGTSITVQKRDGTSEIVHIGTVLRRGSNFATCSFY